MRRYVIRSKQREVRDLWYQVAKIREREGDKEGANRARRNARAVMINDAKPGRKT